MNLTEPVTIQPPDIVRKNGDVRPQSPFALRSLNVTIVDNASGRLCSVFISPFPGRLTLWSGDAYDAAGDYTQSQVEARVLELLGTDIKAGLESLFVMPQRA